jgi:hypothetical protein
MNLVTPKAGAKHELLLNKPASASGLRGRFDEQKLVLSCSFRCDPFHNNLPRFLSHFVVLLKSDLDVQQTYLCNLTKSHITAIKCGSWPYLKQ